MTMNARETIPITVEPEAAARIAELGFQEHMDRMIEHAMQTLPQISRIEVVMNYRYDEDTPDGVWVEVHSYRPYNPEERIGWDLTARKVHLFPPEVLQYLNMSFYPGNGNAG
jgi:hypothetical protein